MPTFKVLPISLQAGVDMERTALATTQYTFSDKIRFRNGYPEKIGGWQQIIYNSGESVSGVPRSVYSFNLNGQVYTLIGTNTRLYSLVGSDLQNITPLQTTTTAAPNSLATYYKTLSANPIATIIGSNTITITDTATKVRVGDFITLSGAVAVGGIPATDINNSLYVRSATTNAFTVRVNTAATSSTTGGGAAVNLATPIITVTSAAHGQAEGDRIKITGATATGGIPATSINREFVIRNVTTNTFDIVTDTTATSSVTAAGGAATVYQKQIPAGSADQSNGTGYGVGLYGTGLYGVSKSSNTAIIYPRLWSFDRFGAYVVLTPGGQTGVYYWTGDTTIAPQVVANAPTAINYLFVDNNIVVTLGASGVENRVQWCDQGNLTVWTTLPTNQAGQQDIQGAGRLMSHASSRGTNLLFTNNKTYTFGYIGAPLIWQIAVLDDSIGLIAQNARCVGQGIVYWQGQNNFYMWRGATVELIPSISGPYCSILSYVFQGMNNSQVSKNYAWYNKLFNEVNFHYPSTSSNDPDRIARVNLDDYDWVPDTISRSAAEYPYNLGVYPKLITTGGTLYNHEYGYDDGTNPITWQLNTKQYGSDLTELGVDIGTYNFKINGIIPDSEQTIGNISATINFARLPNQPLTSTNSYVIAPTTTRVSTLVVARVFQYSITGTALGQFWRGGSWTHEIGQGTRR